MDPSPDLSIIIVSYNARDFLKRCLVSIFSFPHSRLGIEVIVVDNASADGNADLVEAAFPGAKLIRNALNLGFAKACNQGLAIANGRYILLLNPDAVLFEETLEKTVAFMDDHPDAGASGCKLIYRDGSWHPSARRFSSVINQIYPRLPVLNKIETRLTSAEYLAEEIDPDGIRAVDYIWGAFLLMRREALSEIGPLDELFFMYSEDEDWCYRARKAGWLVYYAPVAKAVHAKGQSSKLARERMRTELFRSKYKFFLKHMGWRAAATYHALLVLTACLQVASVGCRWPYLARRQEHVVRFRDELSLAKAALVRHAFREG
jgi:GT2 family glycosyltransferase